MSLKRTIEVVNASAMTDEDKATINRLLNLIAKPAREMEAFEIRLAREAAGLTYRQAANLLKISITRLIDLEGGEWDEDAPESIADEMDRIYVLGVNDK